MARKDTLQSKLLTGQSLAATFTGPVTVIKNTDSISYQINVTTTNSIGTFKVQVSDDYTQYAPSEAVTISGNWADLPLGGDALSINAANDVLSVELRSLSFQAIRIVYTSGTAGTGTCDLWISTKQLGG